MTWDGGQDGELLLEELTERIGSGTIDSNEACVGIFRLTAPALEGLEVPYEKWREFFGAFDNCDYLYTMRPDVYPRLAVLAERVGMRESAVASWCVWSFEKELVLRKKEEETQLFGLTERVMENLPKMVEMVYPSVEIPRNKLVRRYTINNKIAYLSDEPIVSFNGDFRALGLAWELGRMGTMRRHFSSIVKVLRLNPEIKKNMAVANILGDFCEHDFSAKCLSYPPEKIRAACREVLEMLAPYRSVSLAE